MRSIKPGRGPSAMGAVGNVAAILFGIFWTVIAYQMTRSFAVFNGPSSASLFTQIFPLFGVIFVLLGIAHLIYHLYNTTSENRLSEFDITEEGEEPDPLNTRFSGSPKRTRIAPGRKYAGTYCPYCGGKVDRNVDYCSHCGKDI